MTHVSKTYLICFSFLFLFINLFASAFEDEVYEDETHRAYLVYNPLINKVLYNFIKQVKDEFGMDCVGDSGQMHEKIKDVGLKFYAYRRATIEEARVLEIILTEKLVNAINSQEELRPYLVEYPFPAKSTWIRISFNNPRGERYCDGSISSVSQGMGILSYEYDYAFLGDCEELEESYEEAKQLVGDNLEKKPPEHQTTKFEAAIDDVFETFKAKMRRKYRSDCWSIGCKKSADYLEEIGTIFIIFRRTDHRKARQIQVYTTEKLLEIVNSNEKLKPFLKEYPFTANRIKMRLEFRKNDLWNGPTKYRDGSLESVTLENENLIYMKESLYKSGDSWEKLCEPAILVGKETYNEALKIVKKPNKLTTILRKCLKI